MRNPDRLDAFYDELKEIHKRHFPDLRAGQLWANVAYENRKRDMFFPEEEEMIQMFRDYANKYGARSL